VNQDYGVRKAFHLKRFAILQILAKRIMVDADGEIIEYELNSPFVYLRSLVQGLSTPRNGKGGSEQIREGASICQKPPTDIVERFLLLGGHIVCKGWFNYQPLIQLLNLCLPNF